MLNDFAYAGLEFADVRSLSLLETPGALDVALESDQSTVKQLAVQYQHRFEVVRDGFNQAGLPVAETQDGLFAWARVPERWHGDSAAFVDWLLNTAGVALMPGVCFGKVGEGWVRISLLKHTAELFQAVARVDRALRGV